MDLPSRLLTQNRLTTFQGCTYSIQPGLPIGKSRHFKTAYRQGLVLHKLMQKHKFLLLTAAAYRWKLSDQLGVSHAQVERENRGKGLTT